MKFWALLISVLISAGVGFGVAFLLLSEKEQQVEIHSQAIIEQVRDVFQLATVRGQYSDLYDYKDYYYYDWLPLRKKAMIKINADVMMGYDLSEVEFRVEESQKKVVIEGLPEATILSKDIQHQYYDIQEGSFNAFNAGDYTRLEKDIRSMVEVLTLDSELPQRAERQLFRLMEGLEVLLNAYGWELEVRKALRDSPVARPDGSLEEGGTVLPLMP